MKLWVNPRSASMLFCKIRVEGKFRPYPQIKKNSKTWEVLINSHGVEIVFEFLFTKLAGNVSNSLFKKKYSSKKLHLWSNIERN